MRKRNKDKYFRRVEPPFFLKNKCFFYGSYKEFSCIGTIEEWGRVVSLNFPEVVVKLNEKDLKVVLDYFGIENYETSQAPTGTLYIHEIKVN